MGPQQAAIVPGMELIDYLNRHFFTRAQLLARCGIDGARLDALQEAGMMPRPSYRLRLQLACDSFFGAHSEEAALDYYAQGYAAWLGSVQGLAGVDEARRVFAARYRARIAELAAAGIAAGADRLASDEHIAAEWSHFQDGTYGLCTASGLPEDIAAKEAAVVVIRALAGTDCTNALAENERCRLKAAVDLLDRASAPFAPHEVARSTRRRLVDDVRRAYRL